MRLPVERGTASTGKKMWLGVSVTAIDKNAEELHCDGDLAPLGHFERCYSVRACSRKFNTLYYEIQNDDWATSSASCGERTCRRAAQ